jgi:hypothetical protein
MLCLPMNIDWQIAWPCLVSDLATFTGSAWLVCSEHAHRQKSNTPAHAVLPLILPSRINEGLSVDHRSPAHAHNALLTPVGVYPCSGSGS